jgi:streptogramin lyase
MLPQVVAVDGTGNTWVVFSRLGGQNILVKYPAASPGTPLSYTLPGGVIPLKIAFDSTGAAWIVTSTQIGSGSPSGTGVLKISAAAPSDCSSGCTSYASPSYLEYPADIAVDGANTAWVVGQVFFSSSGYSGIGATKIVPGAATDCSSGCTAYINSQLMNADAGRGGIAIDGSGNVWLTSYFDGSVIELPAIAASTLTRLVAQPR